MPERLKKLLLPSWEEFSPKERERLRRRRELALALAAFVLAGILTRVLFYLYDVGSAFFIAVFSLNFLLLLVIAAVVVRNALKLLLERRRGVLGSRLRVRMTSAFMLMTLAPCLLMFFITMKFVQISVDFWFKDQIANTMDEALEVGRADYEKTGTRLLYVGKAILIQATENGYSVTSPEFDAFLAQGFEQERLALAGILSKDREELIWHGSNDATASWYSGKAMFNWETIEKQGTQTIIASGALNDYILAVQTVPGKGFLITAESMGPFFQAKLDRIANAASEYKQLWNVRRGIKWMLYFGLSVLTMLIVLGSIWFGFRVAKEVTAPVLAVADAAQRIAKGDLDVRLEGYAGDELGMLVRAFNSMAADLTTFREDQVRANKLLEEQNREIVQHSQYVETILNNIASGVISVDHEGRVSMVNTSARRILDLTGPDDAILGKSLISFLPEDMTRQTTAMFEQFRHRPLSTWQRQINLHVFGQERRLMVNAAGLITPEGENRGFVAVFDDVSEMEKMQRMAAWREVARRIAHEIKNPLTPIKLSAQRLQRKFGSFVEDPAFSQSTDLIVRQVESLQEMVQEFSAFAKLPEVDPKPGDIKPLIAELVELFHHSHPNIAWHLDLPDATPILPMDKNSLRRAFLNILTNAVDALSGEQNPSVQINAYIDTARAVLRLSFADNGPGLSEKELPRLFEPYYSRKKGGTGLGLTIVRSIISDHKGYIRAEVAPGGGALIVVELPLA